MGIQRANVTRNVSFPEVKDLFQNTLILWCITVTSSAQTKYKKKHYLEAITSGLDHHMSQIWINLNRATLAFTSSKSTYFPWPGAL